MDYYRFDGQLAGSYYRFDDQIATEVAVTDTITPPATVEYDSTFTVTNTGFVDGAPSSGTIGGMALTVVGTSVTIADYRIVANGTLVSALGLVPMILSNGTQSASANTTLSLPSGSVETIIDVVDTVTANTLYAALLVAGVTLTTGMKIWYDNTDGSVFNDDGTYFVVQPKYFTLINLSGLAYQYYLEAGEIVDSTPDVPDLGSDVTDVEPGAYVIRSFVTAGINTVISWLATGNALLSLSSSGPFTSSIDAGNGETMYCRVQAPTEFGDSATGGVAGDEFTVTTRDEIAPSLASTQSLTGYINTAFSKQLTTSGGDAPTSWDIAGGADAASYTVSDSGVFTRTVDNDTIGDEEVTVTATNDAGTSDEMTITISFVEYTASLIRPFSRSIVRESRSLIRPFKR